MSSILASQLPFEDLTPDPALADGPVRCTSWCIDGDGHPFATYRSEQTCRSRLFRLDGELGGGQGPEPATRLAAIVIQAEREPGHTDRVVVGIEIGGTEQWLRLAVAETRLVAAEFRHLLTLIEAG